MIRRCFSVGRGFKVDTLPGGIKVATANTISGGPFSATGILVKIAGVNACAQADDLGTASSYVLEKLAFKVYWPTSDLAHSV
jgi:hypothetical protein